MSSKTVKPGSFDADNHYYTKVQNAQLHSQVSYFLAMSNDRIISRFCHLNPSVDVDFLRDLLSKEPAHFRWSGADLFYCTDENGSKKMVVIETNSCPSGQKSMPLLNEHEEEGGYGVLIRRTLKPVLEKAKAYESGKKSPVPGGVLAVVYDKNVMEASGYAAVMADVFGEHVHLVEFYHNAEDPPVRWNKDIMEVRTEEGAWLQVRIAFRYVTQKPWSRFPVYDTKTLVLNPVIACLAGGRNKLAAAKAYDFYNATSSSYGLEIYTPETVRDVARNEIPLWVSSFNYKACVKNPLSNAGQGVATITSKAELDAFMEDVSNDDYDQFIVQTLIGDYSWSSTTRSGQLFHVGTVPTKQNKIYCCDVRMMIHYDFLSGCWRPLVMYSRRSAKPLKRHLEEGDDSWEMLGTNLSYKDEQGKWQTDPSRLIMMDRKDFNKLGCSLDNLIEAFIQTVMSTQAIDNMAQRIVPNGVFDAELFYSLSKDDRLMAELQQQPGDIDFRKRKQSSAGSS